MHIENNNQPCPGKIRNSICIIDNEISYLCMLIKKSNLHMLSKKWHLISALTKLKISFNWLLLFSQIFHIFLSVLFRRQIRSFLF